MPPKEDNHERAPTERERERERLSLCLISLAPGNYYPITSAAYIDDPDAGYRFTFISDRSRGAE